MLGERDPSHYLRALKTTNTPKRLMWLDCASTSNAEQGVFVERWQSAALGSTHWTSRANTRVDDITHYGAPDALWSDVDAWCKEGRRVTMFAYDLAHALRVSQMLVWLPRMGWHLDKIVLEQTAAWCLIRNGNRSLMCCDLKSWCPVSLEQLRADVVETNPDIVDYLAVCHTPALTCENHVVTIRESVLQIFDWINAENLGPFRPTGSGQSYAAYRRRFMKHDLLVHDDVERLAAERAAMWTGRCEAWRHGALQDGPYVEYDMQAAYCNIAAECDVPILARGEIKRPTFGKVLTAVDTHAVLADVTVTIDAPLVPTRHGGRTLWPVGTFRTVLWDPELRLLFANRGDITFHRAWTYDRAPALREFAQWTLDGMGPQTQMYGLVPKRVLKHWSRCLVGRLGLRFRAWEKFGEQDTADLRLVTYIDTDAKTSTDMLIAGHDRLLLADMAEATESLPQIPGWVMSECRRRLWTTMQQVGLASVVYVDTDSIILSAEANGNIYPLDKHAYVGSWGVKGNYRSMHINGPRNYTAESKRHVSGLPLTARQVAPLEFTGQIMRSIKESMRAGELDCVSSIPRTFKLDAPDLRREHLAGGRTRPFSIHPTNVSNTTEEDYRD